MRSKKAVIDIVTELGGIKAADAADKLFAERMDTDQLARLNKIKNKAVRLKIANAIVLCDPDQVFINTASDEDLQFIRDLSLEKDEEKTLPMENPSIHYDLKEEQGRIIDRTFYISNEGEEVKSLTNKMDRSVAFEDIKDQMTGIMKGKLMMVSFYLRGFVGAPASNPTVEISSSTSVMHNADSLYRNVYADFDQEVEKLGHFCTNIHSEKVYRAIDSQYAVAYVDCDHMITYSFNLTHSENTVFIERNCSTNVKEGKRNPNVPLEIFPLAISTTIPETDINADPLDPLAKKILEKVLKMNIGEIGIQRKDKDGSEIIIKVKHKQEMLPGILEKLLHACVAIKKIVV